MKDIYTLFDYLAWRGDLPMDRDPLNEVDGLILTRLSYLPFDGLISSDITPKQTLRDAAVKLLARPEQLERALCDEDRQLLEIAKNEPRFRLLPVSGFVNHIDEKTQTQFSAVTFTLEPGLCFIAYRGTDDTLVGWKESFNMGFTVPVPAQLSALEYFRATAAALPETRFILGGHSKGGNLAVYAGTFADEGLQNRIGAIYNYDGPGFGKGVLDTEGYARVRPKVRTFVPQSSIVGMLLEHEENYKIVNSNQVSVLQHIGYSWEVNRTRLAATEEMTGSSRLINHTLRAFIEEMTPKQREFFVDTVYGILRETKAKTIGDFTDDWFNNMKVILRQLKDLDEDSREVLKKTMGLLLDSAREGAIKTLQGKDKPKAGADDSGKSLPPGPETVPQTIEPPADPAGPGRQSPRSQG